MSANCGDMCVVHKSSRAICDNTKYDSTECASFEQQEQGKQQQDITGLYVGCFSSISLIGRDHT